MRMSHEAAVETITGEISAEQAARALLQLGALLDAADEPTATLANASAFLNELLGGINWVGFYLLRGDELVLGPFQGKPACVRIPVGKGVCGTAIAWDRTQRVANVHAFPGHIACDGASNSEIAIVLHGKDGAELGVLDIDSPLLARFSETDERFLTCAAEVVARAIDRLETK